jgi:hypothetical protein
MEREIDTQTTRKQLGLINASFGKNGETDTSINNTIIKIKKITEKNDKKLTFIILNSERAENLEKGTR